jgi:hypothetical protein
MFSVQTIIDIDDDILASFTRIALQKARVLSESVDFVTIVPYWELKQISFFILFKGKSCSVSSFGRVNWVVDVGVVLKNKLV